MQPPNQFFSSLAVTIFTEMSALALRHGAINLGQGFPDTDGPAWIRQIVADSFSAGPNQYSPMTGEPDLKRAVAEAGKRFHGLDLDPDTGVIITCGATEALAVSFQGLLNQGDEVILIEPCYDSYAPQVRAAGGIPRYVRLDSPDWILREDRLRAAFTSRTKLIVLNSPMNPAARVFSRAELDLVASLARERDVYVLCDEVYEHMIFDGHAQVPLMTLPGMAERCVRIGSAGKTFSMTGLRIGYVSGPPALIKPIAMAHQYMTFSLPGSLQKGVAGGLRAEDGYFKNLINDLEERRNILARGLRNLGFDVFPCQGAYFLLADFSPLGFKDDDRAFCRLITEQARVAAIPLSAFFSTDNGPPPRSIIRFCFAKQPGLLRQAVDRLGVYLSGTRN